MTRVNTHVHTQITDITRTNIHCRDVTQTVSHDTAAVNKHQQWQQHRQTDREWPLSATHQIPRPFGDFQHSSNSVKGPRSITDTNTHAPHFELLCLCAHRKYHGYNVSKSQYVTDILPYSKTSKIIISDDAEQL